MRQVCEYEAFDGTRFKNPIECKKYENYINYCGEVGKVIKAHLFGFSAEYMYGKDKSNLIEQFIVSHKPTQEQMLKYVCMHQTNTTLGSAFKVLFMDDNYAFIEIIEGVYEGFYFVFRLEALPELTNEDT